MTTPTNNGLPFLFSFFLCVRKNEQQLQFQHQDVNIRSVSTQIVQNVQRLIWNAHMVNHTRTIAMMVWPMMNVFTDVTGPINCCTFVILKVIFGLLHFLRKLIWGDFNFIDKICLKMLLQLLLVSNAHQKSIPVHQRHDSGHSPDTQFPATIIISSLALMDIRVWSAVAKNPFSTKQLSRAKSCKRN